MTNRQLIKTAHVWALTALLALGLWAIAGKAGIVMQNQNSNQNSNGNSNSNMQNANRTQNDNRSANRNTGGGMGAPAGMSSQDHKFVMEAAMGGLMEVELGRVAAQRGTSEAVKQFGQRMVDDHSKANEELMSLASSKGMTLPTTLDEKHQKDVTKLSGMSGAEFDRAYAKEMLSDHTKDVREFERQSTRGGDPDIRAFAAKTLPTLQEHLQMARALPGNEGSGNSNSNSGGSRNSNRNSNGNSNNNGNNNGNSNRP
jgi:putative membrane protein